MEMIINKNLQISPLERILMEAEGCGTKEIESCNQVNIKLNKKFDSNLISHNSAQLNTQQNFTDEEPQRNNGHISSNNS